MDHKVIHEPRRCILLGPPFPLMGKGIVVLKSFHLGVDSNFLNVEQNHRKKIYRAKARRKIVFISPNLACFAALRGSSFFRYGRRQLYRAPDRLSTSRTFSNTRLF
jgi:hypothetical protein